MLVHFLRMFDQLHNQVRGNKVEHNVWVGFERQLHEIVNYPGFATWWVDRGHWFSDAFRSLVESQMGAADAPRVYESWNAEA